MSKQHFGEATEKAPVAILMIDEGQTILLAEGDGLSAFAQLADVQAPEALLGQQVAEVFSSIPPLVAGLLGSLEGKTVDTELRRGEQIWELRCHPVRWEDRRFRGAVCLARNVTVERERLFVRNAVVEITTALRKAEVLLDILNVLFRELGAWLPIDRGALLLREPQGSRLVNDYFYGRWKELSENASSPDLFAWMAVMGRQLLSTGQPYYNTSHMVKDDPAGVVMGVPLIAQNELIGVWWRGGETPLRKEERRLVEALGDLVANAVFRVMQREQTERRLRRLAALHAIDRAITSSMDLRVTLRVFLEQATRQLGVDAAAVLLYDETMHLLRCVLARGFKHYRCEYSTVGLSEGLSGRVVRSRQLLVVPDLAQSKIPLLRTNMVSEEKFVTYYGTPLIARGKLIGVFELFHRRPLKVDSEWLNFLQSLTTQAAIAIDNAQLFNDLQRSHAELEEAYNATLEGWVRALDLRDRETEGHTQRVTRRTLRLARAMELPADQLIHIQRGALLHDIGKIGISDTILRKPGPLSKAEWDLMHKHPQYAYDMLSPIEFLRPALDIPLYHHERWDGNGYPFGLRGEDIPLTARIFAIVDVWDALSHDRPYRKAWPTERVNAYIFAQAGKHFDPRLVEIWAEVFNIPLPEKSDS